MTTSMFIGLVKRVHVRKDVLKDDGTVDPTQLKPVARMGDVAYARLGDLFRIARPVWAELQSTAKETRSG